MKIAVGGVDGAKIYRSKIVVRLMNREGLPISIRSLGLHLENYRET